MLSTKSIFLRPIIRTCNHVCNHLGVTNESPQSTEGGGGYIKVIQTREGKRLMKHTYVTFTVCLGPLYKEAYQKGDVVCTFQGDGVNKFSLHRMLAPTKVVACCKRDAFRIGAWAVVGRPYSSAAIDSKHRALELVLVWRNFQRMLINLQAQALGDKMNCAEFDVTSHLTWRVSELIGVQTCCAKSPFPELSRWPSPFQTEPDSHPPN